MKVKIKSCDNSNLFYSKQIGCNLNVIQRETGDFHLPFQDSLFLSKTDCEILSDETPQPEPFDLERALNGEKVVTRDGREVTDLHYFKSAAENTDKIYAVINKVIHGFNEQGHFVRSGNRCSDLFMAPKEPKVVTRWVNVYDNGESCSNPHETHEGAKNMVKRNNGYIGTFPIQIPLP